MTEKEKKKSELEIELEQTIDFLRKRMSEYEFEYNKKLRDIKFLEEENKKLREDVDYFRWCYLDLKKLCEKEWFMLSDEEVTKMFNLDKIK